ncbi:MAG: hypothetical protein IKJ99_02555 [Oscillospiraceae bacterium]|nr:hypothetical protein [Oscillospiraceae bacterium]
MKKSVKWIIAVIAGLLLAAGVVFGFGFVLPWYQAQTTMPEGNMQVYRLESGELQLTWPEAENADSYCVEMLDSVVNEKEEEELVPFYQDVVQGNSTNLKSLPEDGKVCILRIRTMKYYDTWFDQRIRYGDAALEVSTAFDTPEVVKLSWTPDPAADTVTVDFGLKDGGKARVYTVDEGGENKLLKEISETQLVLKFADDGDLPMIPFGGECELVFDAVREQEGIIFYGPITAGFAVDRDNLLDRNLNLQLQDRGYNVMSLSWNETKGEYYEVQRKQEGDEEWTVIEQIPGDGERSYTSPHLPAFESITYRVVAVGGETMEGSDLAAESEELIFETKQSPVFATIWPVKELEVYSDTQKTEVVGKVETGTAYCVLEEKDGMFGIGIDGKTCYIDSNYVLINLPEYMGDLCSYKITNSYSSRYMMHEFELPGMTGKVTAGYSYVKQSDGSYLVPLLYPTAQKLVVAAQTAIDQGYKLKIYDAFRPNVATREMYSLAEKMLNEPLPEKTYTGVKISSLRLPSEDITTLTYGDVMLGGYSLTYYVAQGRSNHNLGIALDLTVEKLEDGKEVRMQTSMHDLSQYSGLKYNTKSARALADIMKSAGFTTLVSEWWHFNDFDSRDTLELVAVYSGINARCWMADDNGWRYRTKRGNYYTDTTETIGDMVYTFDAEGYVVKSEPVPAE